MLLQLGANMGEKNNVQILQLSWLKVSHVGLRECLNKNIIKIFDIFHGGLTVLPSIENL